MSNLRKENYDPFAKVIVEVDGCGRRVESRVELTIIRFPYDSRFNDPFGG